MFSRLSPFLGAAHRSAAPFASEIKELRWEAEAPPIDVSVDIQPSSQKARYPTLNVCVRLRGSDAGGRLEVVQRGWAPRLVDGVWREGEAEFRVLTGTMSLSSTIDVEVALRSGDGARVILGRLVGRLDRQSVAVAPAPLQVVALGRSGTTLLMTLLSRHPEIVVAKPFPYEIRASRYWIHALQRLLEPAELLQSAHTDTFWLNSWWVGLNPFFDSRRSKFFENEYGSIAGRLVADSLTGFYQNEAAAQRKDGVRYFAEKQLPDDISLWTAEAFVGARRIFLVRDPRDMFASMRAFNAKRQAPAFGEEATGNDDEWVGLLAEQVRRVTAQWRASGADAWLVRYEDIVSRPVDALAELLRFLDVDHAAKTIERVLAIEDDDESRYHRTTQTAEASIGRWKSDLPIELQDVASQAFTDALQTFYDGNDSS
jgi:hypothetical protein